MSSSSLLIAIAASERRHVETVDINGAYLLEEMNEEVIMTLSPLLSKRLSQIDPSNKPVLNERGTIAVRLRKALYGCVTVRKALVQNHRVNAAQPRICSEPKTHACSIRTRSQSACMWTTSSSPQRTKVPSTPEQMSGTVVTSSRKSISPLGQAVGKFSDHL
jgi:hypothetical protein